MGKLKSPFYYLGQAVSRGTASFRRGRQASSGRGHDVTESSRMRRAFGLIAGILASPDYHLSKTSLNRLRELCRMHDRRGSLFSGLLNRAQDNIIGSSFDFIPNTTDKELNKKTKDYIAERMTRQYCDASGVHDFSAIAKTAIRAIWNDGDCLLVKQPDGSLLPFEAEQVETPSAKKEKKNIVLGVEMNKVNRHIGYHVRQRAKTGDHGYGSTANIPYKRIAAANAFMPAWRTRFGQTRGVPFLAATLGFFSRFNSYLDFESQAAEINSMLGFKITKEKLEAEPAGTATNDDTDSTYDQLQKFESGMIFELLAGEDVGMVGSERPGDNFEPYVIMCCRIIGVAIGYPLELMLLDFSRTNYSSARASLNEAKKMFRGWQTYCQKNICMPWYRWQIARGIASGTLPANPELFKARCQWPAWEYIDPKKAAEGNAIAISTGTKSISQCIRETGAEPDEVFDEIAADNAKLKERGIVLPSANLKVIAGGAPDEKEEKQEKQNKGQK